MYTKDRATVLDRSLVHTEHPLGENQSLTREGFLLCRNVPIARTGMQEYLNDEIADAEYLDDEQTKRNPLWDARGKNGIVQVDRPEAEVFRPETLASFEGKDVVDDHPDDIVDPNNYHEHTVGVTLNPRRGEGGLSDFIVADLLIKKASAIAAVRAGKREVSAGYDAEYRVLGPGRAQQYDIIANHVALVDRGRCGFRCAIGDKEPDMTQKTKDKQPSLMRRVLDALAKKDRKALEKAMDEMETEEDEQASEKETMNATGTHIHLHLGGEEEAKGKDPAEAGAADEEETEGEQEAENERASGMEARLMKLESAVAQIAEAVRKMASRTGDDEGEAEEEEAIGDEQEGEEEAEGNTPEADEGAVEEEPDEKGKKGKDKAKSKDVGMTGKKSLLGGKTVDKAIKDSKHLKDDFTDAKSGAEILAPGLQMPTFDSAKPAKVTADSICLLKRRALAAATRDEKNGGKDSVTTMLGKRPLAGLDCATIDTVFNGAVALMKDRNSQDDSPRTVSEARGQKKTTDKKAPTSIADLNAANREHYKQNPLPR